MKKNGFTLIELLAIVIVIGMLVTITGPYVIRSINISRKNAFKNSVEGIVRTIKENAEEINYSEMEYTIIDGVITSSKGKTLKTAGGDGETGSAYIDENGRVSLTVRDKDKKWCATKKENESKISIGNYSEGTCKTIAEPTPESCFTVNQTGETITGYTCTDTNVVVPSKIKGVNITTIGEQALSSKNLQSVIISNGVKTIGTRAFANNKLISVVIPKSVTVIGYMSFRSNQLTSVEIPNSVTTIERSAFQTNKLTNIVIPKSVTSIGGISFNDNQLPDDKAFIYARNADGTEDRSTIESYGGKKRKDVVVPDNITNINYAAFAFNDLTSITLPKNLKKIEVSAFANNNLTSITLPNSITHIKDAAFNYNQLQNIIIPSSVTTIGTNVFANNKANMKVTVNKASGSIPGSPWGASSVEWTG